MLSRRRFFSGAGLAVAAGAVAKAALAALAIETVGARRIAHAHEDLVFPDRQHEALVDFGRPVAGNPGRL